MLKHMINRSRIPGTITSLEEVDFSPVFIIGSNRCGTSIMSQLMDQHPDLEGLFSGPLAPELLESNHRRGFCESNHIWSWLISPRSAHITGGGKASLWGHPEQVGSYYRDDPKSEKEALLLVNAVQQYRRTDSTPLIKDQMNILRIGLIRRLFPRARFILVIRDYPDYITSCHHKWFSGKELRNPSIGIHWLTVNTLAIYELEMLAPGDYTIWHYRHLFESGSQVQERLQEMLEAIDLPRFEFDLGNIDPGHRYLGSEVRQADIDHDVPVRIARYEKSVADGEESGGMNRQSADTG